MKAYMKYLVEIDSQLDDAKFNLSEDDYEELVDKVGQLMIKKVDEIVDDMFYKLNTRKNDKTSV